MDIGWTHLLTKATAMVPCPFGLMGNGIESNEPFLRGNKIMNIEINVTELRKQRRPLWMSNFMHDSYADLLGGGGDIYSDRLHPEWERDAGTEVEEQSRS
jgi:hypothetical protein